MEPDGLIQIFCKKSIADHPDAAWRQYYCLPADSHDSRRPTRANNIKKAVKAGIKVAFGTDAGTNYNYHGENAMELILWVREGFMGPREAICSGTRIAAEALGIEDRVGTLEKGKLADFIVVNGDLDKSLEPLMDGVEMVYQGGKRV